LLSSDSIKEVKEAGETEKEKEKEAAEGTERCCGRSFGRKLQ
jgi:hypothetical protein